MKTALNLQDADGITTGRLDSRYVGPDLDRMSSDSEYDPQSNAISSAYTTAAHRASGSWRRPCPNGSTSCPSTDSPRRRHAIALSTRQAGVDGRV